MQRKRIASALARAAMAALFAAAVGGGNFVESSAASAQQSGAADRVLASPTDSSQLLAATDPDQTGGFDCGSTTYTVRTSLPSGSLHSDNPLNYWSYDDTGAPAYAKTAAFLSALKAIVNQVRLGTNYCSIAQPFSLAANFETSDQAIGARKSDGCPVSHTPSRLKIGWSTYAASTIATTCYDADGIESDIVLNTNSSFFIGATVPSGCANSYSLTKILFHELGHALGLGHNDTYGSMMAPYATACDVSPASYGSGDIRGLKYTLGQ